LAELGCSSPRLVYAPVVAGYYPNFGEPNKNLVVLDTQIYVYADTKYDSSAANLLLSILFIFIAQTILSSYSTLVCMVSRYGLIIGVESV
jgi:hypothetical protein